MPARKKLKTTTRVPMYARTTPNTTGKRPYLLKKGTVSRGS